MNLELINKDGVVVVDSRDVAEMTGKKHTHLMRDIRNIIDKLKHSNILYDIYFTKSIYKDNYGREQNCYLLSKEGCELYGKNLRGKAHLKMIELINNNFGEENIISITYPERKEIRFFDMLEDALKSMNLTLKRQMSVLNNKYRIDGFIPKFNLAIEYDEDEHRYSIKKDTLRSSEIELTYGYKFVRLREEDSHAYNIGLVMNEILNLHNVA